MIYFKRHFPPIENVELIARRSSIREIERLRHDYGGRAWRKLKGSANVELMDGRIRLAELHWYECHGIGKKELKIKRFLD